MNLRTLFFQLLRAGVDLDHEILVRRLYRGEENVVIKAEIISVARIGANGAIIVEENEGWKAERV